MIRTRYLQQSVSRCKDLVPSRSHSISRANSRPLVTLAIESSCDDTSVAVLEKDDRSGKATLHFHEKVTSNNKEFQGVNPKIALTSHQQSLAPLIQRGLASLPSGTAGRSHGAFNNGVLDFVSVTRGPGMRSSVSTGLDTAKGFALALDIPLVGVNHMQAHALTPRLVAALSGSPQPSPVFPFVSLLVSGGHTMVLLSESLTRHSILSNTVDIAAGDALDKMARTVLPDEIREAAKDVSYARTLEGWVFGQTPPITYEYDAPANRAAEIEPHGKWKLPVPLANTRGGQKAFDLSMSFTGLASAVDRVMQRSGAVLTWEERKELGRDIMCATFEHISSRVSLSISATEQRPEMFRNSNDQSLSNNQISTVVASGGVAANRFLREILRKVLDHKHGPDKIGLEFPPLELCTDNAAMIAWAGMEMFEAGWESSLDCLPQRKWTLDPSAEDGGILGVGGWKQNTKESQSKRRRSFKNSAQSLTVQGEILDYSTSSMHRT